MTAILEVSAPTKARLPALAVAGDAVRAQDQVEPGSGTAFILGLIPAAFIALMICVMTYGIAVIAFVISPLFLWHQNRKALAQIRGSSIRIGEDQLPELNACLVTFSERLGLRSVPEAYLIETNTINAAAIKYGSRQVVLFTDDLVHACLRTGNPKALSYVVGHELAHIALKHNGLVRSFIRRASKKLSRLDEYSADRVALALVGDTRACFQGMLAIAAGPQMLPYIDVDALANQCEEVADDTYATKAEKLLTHPLLLRRMQRMIGSSGKRRAA